MNSSPWPSTSGSLPPAVRPVRPPFDRELGDFLNNFPVFPNLSDETLPIRRKILMTRSAPEAVLTNELISHEDITIPSTGGELILAILRRKDSTRKDRPAAFYIHGGGLVTGTRLTTIGLLFDWIVKLDMVVIGVEYRLAPEHPYPAGMDDCSDGLNWVASHSPELGIDAAKLVLVGASAGAGIAAGLALRIRDQGGPKLLAQCFLYPMLDDSVSTVSSQQFMNDGIWNGTNNKTAWNWYLNGQRATSQVSVYAAPARASDLSALPPTWLDVGSAEVFRDEVVAFGVKLMEQGNSLEMHVWPGAWHGFDHIVPSAEISKRCIAIRFAWIRRILIEAGFDEAPEGAIESV